MKYLGSTCLWISPLLVFSLTTNLPSWNETETRLLASSPTIRSSPGVAVTLTAGHHRVSSASSRSGRFAGGDLRFDSNRLNMTRHSAPRIGSHPPRCGGGAVVTASRAVSLDALELVQHQLLPLRSGELGRPRL